MTGRLRLYWTAAGIWALLVTLCTGVAFGQGGGASYVVPGGSGGGSGGGIQGVTSVTTDWMNLSNYMKGISSGSMLALVAGTNYLRAIPPAAGSTFFAADLELTNKQDLIIEGFGKAVLFATNDGVALAIRDCTNILFRGVHFMGIKTNSTAYDPSGFAGFGLIQMTGTNDRIRFVDCTFSTNNFFMVNGGSQVAANDVRTWNLIFERCHFRQCGHTNMPALGQVDGGVAQTSGSMTFENCSFDTVSKGVELFSFGGYPAGGTLRVINCDFRNTWHRAIYCIGGAGLHGRHQIRNCIFSFDPNAVANAGGVVVFSQSAGATIEGCTFTNLSSTSFAIYAGASAFGDSRDVQILNNDFEDITGSGCIKFDAEIGGRISGNRFKRITYVSIQGAGTDNLITDNWFEQVTTSSLGGQSPISFNTSLVTNAVISGNVFIRRSGGGPAEWVLLDSNARNVTLKNNYSYDLPGGIVPLTDSGVGTIAQDAFNISGTWRRTISGTGNGNTNYALTAQAGVMYLGSSNINLTSVTGTTRGHVQKWTAWVTNLSAINWGIGASSTTNRWMWYNSITGATNAPTVLSNSAVLVLEGQSDGTNTSVAYRYVTPGLINP